MARHHRRPLCGGGFGSGRGDRQHRRRRQGCVGRRAARRHRRGEQPGADRKIAHGGHRRSGRVQDRRPAARRVCRDVFPYGLRHREARGRRADQQLHRADQCRDEGRLARRDDHRHGREPGRRHAEHRPAARARERSARCATPRQELQRLHGADAGRGRHGDQSGCGRHEGREHAGLQDSREPRGRFPAAPRRHVLRYARRGRQLHVEHESRDGAGGRGRDQRLLGGCGDRRRPHQRDPARRRQLLQRLVQGRLRQQPVPGQQHHRRSEVARRAAAVEDSQAL